MYGVLDEIDQQLAKQSSIAAHRDRHVGGNNQAVAGIVDHRLQRGTDFACQRREIKRDEVRAAVATLDVGDPQYRGEHRQYLVILCDCTGDLVAHAQRIEPWRHRRQLST